MIHDVVNEVVRYTGNTNMYIPTSVRDHMSEGSSQRWSNSKGRRSATRCVHTFVNNDLSSPFSELCKVRGTIT